MAASMAALTGQTMPAGACLDSFNVLDALVGKHGAQGRDHIVQQDNGSSGTFALRVGDWKLHHYKKKTARNVVVETKLANTKVPEYQLFNVKTDPAEKVNVIADNSEVADRLKMQLNRIINDGRSR